MILTNLIIPLSVINASILIIIMISLMSAATESVDLINDLSPILKILTKRSIKFFVKQQMEDTVTKNHIMATMCISIVLLTIHSVVNVVTAKSHMVCWKMALIRTICEHTTSLARVFVCFVGCCIFVAIIAADLTICMPTPTYPYMNPYVKFSKANSWFKFMQYSSYVPGTYLPKIDSIEISKRSVRRTSDMKNNYKSITMCEHCDDLRLSSRQKQDKMYNICNRLWQAENLYKNPNISQNNDEVTAVTRGNELILSCDSGESYVSIGVIQMRNNNNDIEMDNIGSGSKVKRGFRDYIEPETDIFDYDEDEEKYENVLLFTKQGHNEACRKMQDLLPNGLFLVASALTCMSLILLLSRCERDPCKCGYRKTSCVCEIKVCGCRARGAGVPIKISGRNAFSSHEPLAMKTNRDSTNYEIDCTCAPVILSETEIKVEEITTNDEILENKLCIIDH